MSAAILWRFARPQAAWLALGAALMLAESAAALAVPWVGGLLAQSLLDAASPSVRFMLWMLLALFAGQALVRFAAAHVLDGAADRIVAGIKRRLYDHLQSLPLAYFEQRRLGDSLAMLGGDVYVVGAFITGAGVALAPLLVTAAGAAVLMLGIRADLALLVLLLVPLFVLLVKVVGRGLRPLSAQLQDEEARAFSIAQENLELLPAIKSYTREQAESARHAAQVGRVLDIAARQRRAQAALSPLLQFMAAAGVVLILALAGTDLLQGSLAAGALVSFLLYAQLLSRPVGALADVYGQAQTVRGALDRIARAMAAPPEAAGPAARLPRVRGEIDFRGVRFAYPGREAVVEGIDLHIAAGETVAIVGANGAGKSTLGHLLTRLHDPGAGSIHIDGIDVAGVSVESLRAQVGVVPQHVMLFHASVRDNIAFGREGADARAVEAAARVAGAHDFIVELPEGYDTLVGDRGARLSGGQQQRLALARALVKDPPILVLDEATAMFDPEGEEDFLHACRDLLRRRTVIFITHRAASLRVADRVVTMEAGRIVEIRPAQRLRVVSGQDD